MRSSFPTKAVVIVFVVVMALYFLTFKGIEYLRVRKGPWEVAFGSDTQGNATLTVSQPALGLSGVRIVAHGDKATNGPGTVRFDQVTRPVPAGRVIYEDLTFLPGVVTFDFYGHEVELLPRALIVNKRLVPWQSGATVDLWSTNKAPEPPQPPKTRRR
jgi:hypothetical protein